MRIHQIRNATLVIESGDHRILLDPMLGNPGTLPPYSLVRFRALRNPLKPLPATAEAMLEAITAGLVTHTHFNMDCDHLDAAGAKKLAGAPVFCSAADERGLKRRGLDAKPLTMGQEAGFFGGAIKAVPASHGRCVMSKLMGPGAGYVIRLPDEPSLYITGDTILTQSVRETLERERPDICILPCGSAQLDFGGPILMPIGEILDFVRLAPGKVIANHLECLNHCPTTREGLVEALRDAGLAGQVIVPLDGQTIDL